MNFSCVSWLQLVLKCLRHFIIEIGSGASAGFCDPWTPLTVKLVCGEYYLEPCYSVQALFCFGVQDTLQCTLNVQEAVAQVVHYFLPMVFWKYAQICPLCTQCWTPVYMSYDAVHSVMYFLCHGYAKCVYACACIHLCSCACQVGKCSFY